jgi:hypothetical protein
MALDPRFVGNLRFLAARSGGPCCG